MEKILRKQASKQASPDLHRIGRVFIDVRGRRAMTLSIEAATAITRDIGINAAKIARRKAFAIFRCANAEPASKRHEGTCN